MHIPVLLNEIITVLGIKPGAKVIDATFGGGGYGKILGKLAGPAGKVLGIDADTEAVTKAKALKELSKNVTVVSGNFRNIVSLAEKQGLKEVDAIVFDLGLSSNALDNPDRGFSFQLSGPLDMRFNTSQALTAANIVNDFSEKELAEIFKEYGEEKLAARIARAVVNSRNESKIENTDQLRKIIDEAVPGKFKKFLVKTKSRIFQALRIKVNDELENLKLALSSAFCLLGEKGKLAVVSYHSLEDRIVKQYFASLIKGCVCPPDFPTCVCGKKAQARAITRKPIIPDVTELANNNRARSAKLRAVEKLTS